MVKKDISEVERNFIDRTGKIAKQWGLGEPSGRVWATLLFSENPLSQKQIAEKTGYSLSLVSPSLKILESLNMIRKIRGEGKEKLYELTATFIEAFNLMIKRFLENDIKPLIQQLEEVNEVTLKKNPKLQGLVKEYKHLELYLGLFGKMIFMKKVTADKIKRLLV